MEFLNQGYTLYLMLSDIIKVWADYNGIRIAESVQPKVDAKPYSGHQNFITESNKY